MHDGHNQKLTVPLNLRTIWHDINLYLLLLLSSTTTKKEVMLIVLPCIPFLMDVNVFKRILL